MMSYPVMETFYSLQGEGIFAGVPAFFIRLAGCDVGRRGTYAPCNWMTLRPFIMKNSLVLDLDFWTFFRYK